MVLKTIIINNKRKINKRVCNNNASTNKHLFATMQTGQNGQRLVYLMKLNENILEANINTLFNINAKIINNLKKQTNVINH